MHIRNRSIAAGLQRARERRAWGSLAVCAALGGLAVALCRGWHSPAPEHADVHAPVAMGVFSTPPASSDPVALAEIPPVQVYAPLPTLAPAMVEAAPLHLDLPDTAPLAAEWEAEPADSIPLPVLQVAAAPAPPARAASPAAPAVAETSAPIIPPAYKSTPTPPYPPALRAGRIEGSVRVRIAVDSTGRPTRVDILTGSGHREFDTCAQDWILGHWLFTPARRGDTPIAGSVTTSVHFVLR